MEFGSTREEPDRQRPRLETVVQCQNKTIKWREEGHFERLVIKKRHQVYKINLEVIINQGQIFKISKNVGAGVTIRRPKNIKRRDVSLSQSSIFWGQDPDP